MTFHIRGMDCADCARTVQNGVARLEGVQSCELSFASEKLTVRGDVDQTLVMARVRELGYEADAAAAVADAVSSPAEPLSLPRFLWERTDTRLALLGALLILPGIVWSELLGREHSLVSGAALLALLLAGGPVARSAWRALRINHDVNINVLMTVAAVGAVVIGEVVEAGLVMVLFAVGEALEGFAAGRSRHAIRSLLSLVPPMATRLAADGGAEEAVPVAALAVGDHILVRPGERIPMDGVVLTGHSLVNQAPITGESALIDKGPGAEVFAGTVNNAGALTVAVRRRVEDNTISRIIHMVEEAQEKKAPAQRFVDRFARVYTPAVMVLAALTAVAPPLFFGQPFLDPAPGVHGWLYRGLALLVVACPCALVISTPVTIVSAISNGARHGVLFKGGAALETLSRVRVVALDKTGTLTHGRPAVVAVQSADCTANGASCPACDDLLALASAVERRSEHPLAQAVVDAATSNGVADRYAAAEEVVALSGRGVTGTVGERQVMLANHAYFDGHVPHTDAQCRLAEEAAAAGRTPVLLSVDGAYAGQIALADAVRASSRTALAQLQRAGVARTVMLTGDAAGVAQRIGAGVGVDEIRAGLLPAEKVAALDDLHATYGVVAMVGDGINDAPALARADVGIAIGGTGSEQALETADVTLMQDGIRQLPYALRLSRAAMGTIRLNVGLSIGIKLLFLGVVLAGWGTMWMAVLADVGTSLLVTLLGLRLLRWGDREPAFDPADGGDLEG